MPNIAGHVYWLQAEPDSQQGASDNEAKAEKWQAAACRFAWRAWLVIHLPTPRLAFTTDLIQTLLQPSPSTFRPTYTPLQFPLADHFALLSPLPASARLRLTTSPYRTRRDPSYPRCSRLFNRPAFLSVTPHCFHTQAYIVHHKSRQDLRKVINRVLG